MPQRRAGDERDGDDADARQVAAAHRAPVARSSAMVASHKAPRVSSSRVRASSASRATCTTRKMSNLPAVQPARTSSTLAVAAGTMRSVHSAACWRCVATREEEARDLELDGARGEVALFAEALALGARLRQLALVAPEQRQRQRHAAAGVELPRLLRGDLDEQGRARHPLAPEAHDRRVDGGAAGVEERQLDATLLGGGGGGAEIARGRRRRRQRRRQLERGARRDAGERAHDVGRLLDGELGVEPLVREAPRLRLGQVQLDVGAGAGAHARARRLEHPGAERLALAGRARLRLGELQPDVGGAHARARLDLGELEARAGDVELPRRFGQARAALAADLDHLLDAREAFDAARRRHRGRAILAAADADGDERVGGQEHAGADAQAGDDVALLLRQAHQRAVRGGARHRLVEAEPLARAVGR